MDDHSSKSIYILLYLCHEYKLQQDITHLSLFLKLTLFARLFDMFHGHINTYLGQ